MRIPFNVFVSVMTPWRRILVTAFLALLVTAGAASAESKRVLLLHSFSRDFVPWNEFARVLREELDRQSPQPLDIFEASLDTARSAEDQEGPFADYLRALFAKRRLDLVIAIGAPAASFFQRNRQQLFPAAPMLFTGVEQRRVTATALTANDAVVAISIDLAGAIGNMLRVLPDTTSIAVVIGDSPADRYWMGQLRAAIQPFEHRVAFTWWNALSFEQMLERAATLPPRSAIFFGLLSVDAAGVAHEEGKAMARLHAVANAPVLSHNDAFFGHGVVGGPMTVIASVGREAASAAVRILGGEQPNGIKTPPIGFGPPKFDSRELKRWGISKANLPPGSEVHFREPTLWDQYRWQMVAISAAILVQAALIFGLLLEHNRRRLAELDARRRVLEVAHLNRTATAGVMSASIAHELNQPLGAILINTETAETLLQADQLDHEQIREILVEIRQDDQRAAKIIRGLAGFLRRKDDIEMQELDLNEVVRGALHILEPEAARKGVALSADQAPAVLAVRADPVHLQQVILNLAINGMDAMQNAANGRSIAVQTSRTGESHATVSVSDNGPGIPEEKLNKVFETFYTTKKQGSGLGLSIARTIVEIYGGRIWAENRLGGGAVFAFTLPLTQARPTPM